MEESAILCQQLAKTAFNADIHKVDDAQACQTHSKRLIPQSRTIGLEWFLPYRPTIPVLEPLAWLC